MFVVFDDGVPGPSEPEVQLWAILIPQTYTHFHSLRLVMLPSTQPDVSMNNGDYCTWPDANQIHFPPEASWHKHFCWLWEKLLGNIVRLLSNGSRLWCNTRRINVCVRSRNYAKHPQNKALNKSFKVFIYASLKALICMLFHIFILVFTLSLFSNLLIERSS